MRISILSIAPEQFASFQEMPLVNRSIEKGLLELEIVDVRDYVQGSFRKVDDSPYGGGAGMIMRVEPVLKALKAKKKTETTVLIMAPIGKRFDQKMAHELSLKEDLLIICGHYEGMDARIYDYADELISIGDYILTGGELAAMVVCDSLLRLLDGSMKKESVIEESFEEGLLEYPQYTRPAEYDGKRVPEVLLSGDHEKIRQWRKQEARKLTELRRPDLLEKEK